MTPTLRACSSPCNADSNTDIKSDIKSDIKKGVFNSVVAGDHERMTPIPGNSRQAVRRPLSWTVRVLISVSIPLVIGLGAVATGLPRKAYQHADTFWEFTGIYEPTMKRYPAVPAHRGPKPLPPRLRYVTEAVLYVAGIVPGFVLAIFVYDRLTFRYMRDRHLRCPQCGHILSGLSEPRCPECGRPI
jgi:hypothetical protein